MNWKLLDRTKKYLVAVSFGPDSLALLDMLYIAGFTLAVAHVNYHKRPTSNLEQSGLEQYCLARDIPLYVLDVNAHDARGNFQAWARTIRYRFFKEIITNNGYHAVLTAHHLDDHLETIIMQQKRQTMGICKGICSETELLGIHVLRPLLDTLKHELISYCVQHGLNFAHDESNDTDTYERNRVRHHVVPLLTDKQRDTLLLDAQITNDQTQELLLVIHDKITAGQIKINDIRLWNERMLFLAIYLLCDQQQLKIPITRNLLKEVRNMTSGERSYWKRHLRDNYWLIRSYDVIELRKMTPEVNYEYRMDTPGKLDTPYFYLDFTHGSHRDIFKESDYPLHIRNAQKGDSIMLDGHQVKLRRLFIDWKLPRHRRLTWPVMLDGHGVIRFVPRFRPDFLIKDDAKFYVK